MSEAAESSSLSRSAISARLRAVMSASTTTAPPSPCLSGDTVI